MKTIFFFLFAIFSMSCSQKKATVKKVEIISQQIVAKEGKQVVIKKVSNDSRCPEGVNCIWAGEIEIVFSIYNNNKFEKDSSVKISPMLQKENIEWFSKFYLLRTIKEIVVLPYPKEGTLINPKEYIVEIYF